MSFIRGCTLALLAGVLPFAAARAAWDPDGNRLSFQGEASEYSARSFGDGGVLVAWSAWDPTAMHVYVQMLDPDGNVAPGWSSGGRLITATGGDTYPLAIPDEFGGVFVTWQEGYVEQRVLRLTATGTVAPGWPETGLVIPGRVTSRAARARIAADHSGGVYLTWTDYVDPPAMSEVRLLRIGPDGSVSSGWPADGVVVGNAYWAWALAADAAGKATVALEDFSESPNNQIVVRRFASDGASDPTWPALGVTVDSGRNQEWKVLRPNLVLDGAGGVYVNWLRLYLPCPSNSYECPSYERAVHLDSTGRPARGWSQEGAEYGPMGAVAPDGAGGLLIGTTSSPRGTAQEIRGLAIHVAPNGALPPGWESGGNPVCSERQQQTAPVIVPDGSGGAYVGWVDYRTSEYVLYASRLTSSGSIASGWPEAGSIESPATMSPGDLPQLVPSRSGEAIVVWEDNRTGNSQLFAKPVRPGPSGPAVPDVGFAIRGISVNPVRGPFFVYVSVQESFPARLELYDLMSRRLESHEITGGGNRTIQMNANASLRPGLYFLRLWQNGSGSIPRGSWTARVVIVH